MSPPALPRNLDVSGLQPVLLLETGAHQDDLLPLIHRHPDDPPRSDTLAHLLPVLGRTARCEVEADGHTIGELPPELAAEVHTGLLALALLDPPYVVAVPLQLAWRELQGRSEVTATAMIDLDELRLLAS